MIYVEESLEGAHNRFRAINDRVLVSVISRIEYIEPMLAIRYPLIFSNE